MYDNILELIGNTPIVKLNRLPEASSAAVYVKLESANPGGSVKDRICNSMICAAEEANLIVPGKTTIVEPTSGNTGIGLAMVCAVKGYHLILTMPESMSIERRTLLAAYGAELVLTPAAKGMKGAIDMASKLANKNTSYFMPQQFNNPANPKIHRETTAQEIWSEFGSSLDVFVAGIGTGGTITGVGEVLKEKNDQIKIYGLEPQNSAVLNGDLPGPHKIQGVGAGFVPKVLNTEIYDQVIKITDENALATANRLAKQEGILVGISSGAACFAALNLAKELGPDQKVLAILPDTGERYLSIAAMFS